MVLAKPIFNAEGKPLLTRGTSLTPAYLKRVSRLGISTLYIEDERTDGVVVGDIIDSGTRLQAIKLVSQVMRKVTNLKDTSSYQLPVIELKQMAGEIVNQLIHKKSLTLNNSDMKNLENYTAAHCVNTAVLSTLIGIKAGFSKKKLEPLCLGGLLHDLGKAKIPPAVLNKPGRLTNDEFKIIQTHSEIGYKIITATPNRDISLPAAHVAWQHQEKCNGKGYPRGLDREKIHEYARIAAVADVFDALSSDRVYKKRMLPHLAFKVIAGADRTHFDFDFVRIFAANVATFPIGTLVEISTGDRGIVVRSGSRNIHTPVIRILSDSSGNSPASSFEIDLSEFSNYTVTKILDDI